MFMHIEKINTFKHKTLSTNKDERHNDSQALVQSSLIYQETKLCEGFTDKEPDNGEEMYDLINQAIHPNALENQLKASILKCALCSW